MEGLDNLFIVLILVVFKVVPKGITILKLKWKQEEREEQLGDLSEEQKAKLEASKVDFIQSNEWMQPGLVYKISGSNATVLWYNRTIQEELYREIRCSEAKVSRAEQTKYNLQPGDFVKLHYRNGKIDIVWD